MLVKRGPYWATFIGLNAVNVAVFRFVDIFILALLWAIVAFFVWLAVFVGRCGDADSPRWLFLLLFIPLIGLVVVIVVGFRPTAGNEGEDKVGRTVGRVADGWMRGRRGQ